MWHIGQRVVCVDDKFNDLIHAADIKVPSLWGIYTIRDVSMREAGLGIQLEEIANKNYQFKDMYGEPAFLSHRFKPLDEKRIDIFRAMLKNKEKEKVYE